MSNNKSFLIVLIILNAIVLLGQLWPAGAPPFARFVNIAAAGITLLFLFTQLKKK